MTFFGGYEDAERVRRIAQRAHEVIAAGLAALAPVELPACECNYPDGEPRYVDEHRHIVHMCGR